MRKYFSLFPDHIKSGSDKAVIRASWEYVGNQGLTESLIYNLGGMDDVRAGAAEVQWSAEEERAYRLRNDNPNPFYRWPVLYLHSYRRISSEKLSLADVSGNGKNKTMESPGVAVSDFKALWFRVIMESFEFFDEIPSAETKKAREILEQLLNKYADVSIAKPSIKPDNTIDLQVKPHDGSGTFSLDGLSSGQKEIIATLFYIWYLTKDRPAVVLIDEPELHLNTEWHRTFIRTVNEISPHNQYILATHSFDVFDSVNPLHRALLTPSETALQP